MNGLIYSEPINIHDCFFRLTIYAINYNLIIGVLMKKHRTDIWLFVIVILLVVLSFLFGTIFTKVITIYTPVNENEQNAQIDFQNKEDYTIVTPQIDGTTLSFVSDCYTLSFDITEDQAYSIFRGMQKVIEERPLTHDTLKDILEDFNIDVISVRIDDKRDDIYTARVLLIQGSKALDIDVRPSDATALAIRSGVPIYIKTDILVSDGENRC